MSLIVAAISVWIEERFMHKLRIRNKDYRQQCMIQKQEVLHSGLIGLYFLSKRTTMRC